MRAASGREFAKAAERKGWVFLRAHGSHQIYGREGSVVRLTIPMHDNHPLKAGLLHHLMKLADLSEEEL
jgi:predicted RNA binding protein YcfA (HicA-like mRNA interferase family)